MAAFDLIVSPVNYRLYHEGPPLNDHLDALMHKRLGFKHEGEVRLLRYDEPHCLALAFALTGGHECVPPPAVPPDLPEHIFLNWNASNITDAITISPYATEGYEQRVRVALAEIDSAAATLVELSVLSERRYKPLF